MNFRTPERRKPLKAILFFALLILILGIGVSRGRDVSAQLPTEDDTSGEKVFMPVIVYGNASTPTPTATPPAKLWSGMHLGNRNTDDWDSEMLAPLDADQGGAWPRLSVVLSNQLFTLERNDGDGEDCKITGVTIKNENLYGYLRRAAQSGQTTVVICIYPSPGNFLESIQDAWPTPLTRPRGRTLLVGNDERPGGWPQCNQEWRFRTFEDIGDEMIAIQQYVNNDGWSVYGFEPANEPNIEWYDIPHPDGNFPSPNLTETDAWWDMDDYFSKVYDYVHSNVDTDTDVRVLTPPMSQGAYAEKTVGHSLDTPCPTFDFSGYEEMDQTFNSDDPKNDGYSWHNYWIAGRETWAECPSGQHVALWFPDEMSNVIRSGNRSAFITEADLGPPQFGWDNSITSKKDQPIESATSIQAFLFDEFSLVPANDRGADRIAVWLLNDDTGREQHIWAQAYEPGTGFLEWFQRWWYGSETP